MGFSLIPDRVFSSVAEIRPEWLTARGITLLLADLDNTLVRYGPGDPAPEVLAWREGLRTAGVELFLLSNSRKPDRPGRYAKRLDIPYLGHAGKPRTAGFEQAMARLEEIVAQLEAGDHPLAESLSLYEEGAKLMKQCVAMLDKAEQKVMKLRLDETGELKEVPFVPEES